MFILACVCVSMCACQGPEADVAHLPQFSFTLGIEAECLSQTQSLLVSAQSF